MADFLSEAMKPENHKMTYLNVDIEKLSTINFVSNRTVLQNCRQSKTLLKRENLLLANLHYKEY